MKYLVTRKRKVNMTSSVTQPLNRAAVPADLVAIGEVGLTGELRSVSQLGQRVSEVRRLGFTQCLIPSRRTGELAAPAGLRLIPVRNIGEAIRAALRPSE